MENFIQGEPPDCNTYFDRHETQGYTPESYPIWSEKQWGGLWHRHTKFLRERARQVQRGIEQARENEVYKKVQISTIMKMIEIIGEKKQEKIRQDADYTKRRMQSIALVRSRNASK